MHDRTSRDSGSADVGRCGVGAMRTCICQLQASCSVLAGTASSQEPQRQSSTKPSPQDDFGAAAVSPIEFHPHQVSRRKRRHRDSDQSESGDQCVVPAARSLEEAAPEVAYHLENPNPRARKLLLDEKYPSGLVIVEGKNRYLLRSFEGDAVWTQAKASPLIYYPLCEGRIIPAKPRDRASHNAGGRHRVSPRARLGRREDHRSWSHPHGRHAPRNRERWKPKAPAEALGERAGDLPLPRPDRSEICRIESLTSSNLGIDLGGPERTGMTPGAWYAGCRKPGNLRQHPSAESYRPGDSAQATKRQSTTWTAWRRPRCAIWSRSISISLTSDMHWAPNIPRVAWSDHMLAQMRDPSVAGTGRHRKHRPAGLDRPCQLRRTHDEPWRPSPVDSSASTARSSTASWLSRITAATTASSRTASCSASFSPGLATIFVLDDGSVEMKTWTRGGQQAAAADQACAPERRPARRIRRGIPIAGARPPGERVGTGQLVRFRRRETAHDALGRRVAEESAASAS